MFFFPLLGFSAGDFGPSGDLYPLLTVLARDYGLVDFLETTSAFPTTKIANIAGVGVGGDALSKKLRPVSAKLSQVAIELEGSKKKDLPAKGNALLGKALNPQRDCFGRLSLSQGRPLTTVGTDNELRIAAPMRGS